MTLRKPVVGREGDEAGGGCDCGCSNQAHTR